MTTTTVPTTRYRVVCNCRRVDGPDHTPGEECTQGPFRSITVCCAFDRDLDGLGVHDSACDLVATTPIEEFRAAAQRMLDVIEAADLSGDDSRIWGLLGWIEAGLGSLADGTPPEVVGTTVPTFMRHGDTDWDQVRSEQFREGAILTGPTEDAWLRAPVAKEGA